MNREEKLKNRGITLVALIITIIVMLILVGVTLSIALNGGIVAKTQEAKAKTEAAMEEEKNIGNGKVEIDGKTYNSIDEYIHEKTDNEVKEDDIEVIGRFYKGNAGKINITISEDIPSPREVECSLLKVGTINGDTVEWEESLKEYIKDTFTLNPTEEQAEAAVDKVDGGSILARMEGVTMTANNGLISYDRVRAE